MKIQFAALALSAAMLAGTSAYACKDGCDCNGKKDASATTTTAAPAPATSASTTDKTEQTAAPASDH